MEVLSRKLMEEVSKKKSGIVFKIGLREFLIPCLFFADDSLMFCKVKKKW